MLYSTANFSSISDDSCWKLNTDNDQLRMYREHRKLIAAVKCPQIIYLYDVMSIINCIRWYLRIEEHNGPSEQ